jgi:hypothetical protein
MKTDMTDWKEFEVQELFHVVYGVNLELVNCVETDKNDPDAVAFVSRTELNNGISAYVKPVQGVEPQPKDTITVAGGGSVLATFLQTQPFYSGRDLYLLYPKCCISNKVKLFLVTIIKANKYRYNYGRQANVTLPSLKLKLPVTADGIPDWRWMEAYVDSLRSKHLTTNNVVTVKSRSLTTSDWQEFSVNNLFDSIYKVASYHDDELTNSCAYDENAVAYVTRTDQDNSVKSLVRSIGLTNIESGNAIVVGDTTSTISYQPNPFVAGEHIIAARANWLNKYTGLFVTCLLRQERYRYSYGRAYKLDLIRNTKLKLPVTPEGKPDWQFMENYIKSLPYGDRL